MAESTGIQWTDHTFNPWIGCTKVSPGCTHCYAEKEQFPRVKRAAGVELWGPKAARHITSATYWRQPILWDLRAREGGRRERVFCASLADVCEDRRDLDEPRTRLRWLISSTPGLDWQLLSKRPEHFPRLFPWGESWPSNIWAMTSAENQEYANRRIPELLKVPTQIRGLSLEPLLGPIGLKDRGWLDTDEHTGKPGISWVIIGGESGPQTRPCHIEWVRSLVQQCQAAGVACFVKQLGARVASYLYDSNNPGYRGVMETHYRHHKGGDPAEWPENLRVREFPDS